jgi:hypothetical protein
MAQPVHRPPRMTNLTPDSLPTLDDATLDTTTGGGWKGIVHGVAHAGHRAIDLGERGIDKTGETFERGAHKIYDKARGR